MACGAGTAINPSSHLCEIDCMTSRRLAEPDAAAAVVGAADGPLEAVRQIVSAHLKKDPQMAARLGQVDGELLRFLENVSEQLFGQPALA